jgi:peptidyl-prolyl cis-trans isomerase C
MRNLSVIGICVLLSACSASSSSDNRLIRLSGDLPVAETVNGTAVPQTLIEAFAKAHGADLTQPEQRAQILRLFADYVLLAEQAKRDNLLANPQFAAEVEVARLTALAKATMSDLQQQTPLSEQALKAEYDAQIARTGKFEYDFSQLLFANEDDAIKATGEVLGGKPFPQVYDAWKDKAKQAKVFTRIKQEQLPEALAKALAEMKNGETLRAPIKTQFGWHVVHLDIANPFTPPPFEQIKEKIRQTLSQQVAAQRLDKLKEQARIEYPPGSAPLVPDKAAPDAMPAKPAAAAAPPPAKNG